ncbi:MAG: hypothetical protein OQK04_15365, partial [Kangiellaceae bacterium]|nr:hypothetical protein [Kangiellaceae bacterium]
FDDIDDYRSIQLLENVEVIESDGPIELYFKNRNLMPFKVVTAGSGATETLRLIYDCDIEVCLPDFSLFMPESRDEMRVLTDHFKSSFQVRVIKERDYD